MTDVVPLSAVGSVQHRMVTVTLQMKIRQIMSNCDDGNYTVRHKQMSVSVSQRQFSTLAALQFGSSSTVLRHTKHFNKAVPLSWNGTFREQ